jgi:hypothetical protein
MAACRDPRREKCTHSSAQRRRAEAAEVHRIPFSLFFLCVTPAVVAVLCCDWTRNYLLGLCPITRSACVIVSILLIFALNLAAERSWR